MRRKILICIAACFFHSGLVAFARWWTQRSGPRLIVLNYHRAGGENLLRHLLYLRCYYRILPIEAALEELFSQTQSRDRRSILALTFDDGYCDNHMSAFSLACKLQIPFTIYLVPGYVASGAHFWWIEGARLVRRAQVKEAVIEGCRYSLEKPASKARLARMIDMRIRSADSVAEREQFLTSLRKILDVPSSILVEDIAILPLSWEQVRAMNASGLVSFGAHTMNHPILSCLSNPVEVQYEVEECRRILERQLGYPVRSFAYPIGQQQHINEEVIDAVRRAGYTWALTTQYGFNTPESDPYLLRRIEVDVDQHWLIMAAATAGLWGIFARLRWLPFVRKHLTNSR